MGILIALIIRNWYHEGQLNNQIDQTAVQIIEDLTLDTAIVNGVIKHYEPKEAIYKRIMADSMDVDDVKACADCKSLVSLIVTFEPNVIGYTILKEFDTNLKTEKDSLIHDTKFFYSRFISGIELLNDMIKTDIRSNLNVWKNEKPWYPNMILGIEDERYYDYIANDPQFRNMATNFYLLIYKNYLNAMRIYVEQATVLADRLKTMLERD